MEEIVYHFYALDSVHPIDLGIFSKLGYVPDSCFMIEPSQTYDEWMVYGFGPKRLQGYAGRGNLAPWFFRTADKPTFNIEAASIESLLLAINDYMIGRHPIKEWQEIDF
jgi:hypothetical protein